MSGCSKTRAPGGAADSQVHMGSRHERGLGIVFRMKAFRPSPVPWSYSVGWVFARVRGPAAREHVAALHISYGQRTEERERRLFLPRSVNAWESAKDWWCVTRRCGPSEDRPSPIRPLPARINAHRKPAFPSLTRRFATRTFWRLGRVSGADSVYIGARGNTIVRGYPGTVG